MADPKESGGSFLDSPLSRRDFLRYVPLAAEGSLVVVGVAFLNSIAQAQGESPDLIIDDLEAKATIDSKLVEATGKVKNQGSGCAGPSLTRLDCNGVPLVPAVSVDALQPGESQEFSDTFSPSGDIVTFQASGFVRATADSRNVVEERNEWNNSQTIEIKPPLPPPIRRIFLPAVFGLLLNPDILIKMLFGEEVSLSPPRWRI